MCIRGYGLIFNPYPQSLPTRPIRTVAVLPTMFTLGNLVCGFFAIVVAARVVAPAAGVQEALMNEDTANAGRFSGWLIVIAMLFDALDGYVARLSRTASEFGKQLDSLCDVVTFGVAPGFLLVKMCPRFALLHREAVWVIAASYAGLRRAAAGAVRRRVGRR